MNRPQRPTSSPHPDPNACIDLTLRHFAEVEPTPGFEARLLQHLEERLAAPRPRRIFNPLPAGSPFRFAAPFVVAVLVLLLVAPALMHHRRKNERRLISSGLRDPRVPSSAKSPLSALGQPPLSAAATHTDGPVPLPVPPVDRQLPVPLSNAASASGSSGQQADAQALADLHAPSAPAPPEPLTAQERSLLRMMRRGEGRELADLGPATEPGITARERAAFHAFFEPRHGDSSDGDTPAPKAQEPAEGAPPTSSNPPGSDTPSPTPSQNPPTNASQPSQESHP